MYNIHISLTIATYQGNHYYYSISFAKNGLRHRASNFLRRNISGEARAYPGLHTRAASDSDERNKEISNYAPTFDMNDLNIPVVTKEAISNLKIFSHTWLNLKLTE